MGLLEISLQRFRNKTYEHENGIVNFAGYKTSIKLKLITYICRVEY
jgi:hypothetical protein